VHPRQGQPAARVLVLATKGSRGGLMVAAPLVLHENDGGFTPEAAAIHAGDTASFPKV
jgi:tRNA1(Val) A37 N6-methylase TrmN6